MMPGSMIQESAYSQITEIGSNLDATALKPFWNSLTPEESEGYVATAAPHRH